MNKKLPFSLILGALFFSGQMASAAEAPRVQMVFDKGTQIASAAPDSLKLDLSSPTADEATAPSGDAPAKSAPAAAMGPAVKAVIDLGSQQATIYVNGQQEHTWKISSARMGYVTPNGTFRPQWLARMHYSKKYDYSPMPYSVFFHGGYAIHGTESVGRLGRPASHGCIRLHPSNAQTLFNLVQKHGKGNTRIVIVGSPNHGSASRYADNSGSGSFWGFPSGGTKSNANCRACAAQEHLKKPFSLDHYNL